MDWLVALLILVPAFILYRRQSMHLVDYLIWITVLNRGIRRYVDWMQGSFNPFSPISLTPLVIAGFIFLVVIQRYAEFPDYFKKILQFFGIALGLAFLTGVLFNGFAAVYAMGEYIAPISVIGFAALARGDEYILDRWVKTIGWSAVFAAGYGWYQYYTIPKWDAFWVTAVGFEGYLGYLRPTEMTVFSTMSERGVLGGFLSFAVIPMIISKRWRNCTGWLSVVLILSVILLTYVRTAVITVALATVLFPILNRGKNSIRIVIVVCLAAVGLNFVLSQLPSAKQIEDRLETLQSISEDGSFQGRIGIAGYGIITMLKNPLGTGLGSTGLGGRVNTGSIESGAVIGDNGYLEIMLTFGWIGSVCFFYAIYLLWKNARHFERIGAGGEAHMLFKTIFVTGAVVLMVGNWFAGPGAMLFCILSGFALYPPKKYQTMLALCALLVLSDEQESAKHDTPQPHPA